ncbi:MAG: lysine transporter LysE, partial [Pygmaiobacter sp.]|nr:lysine transporter LysE [Pygmaiobacter sp.]
MIYWKGLRFGLLLQLAVGPVCLFVFSSAARYGTAVALAAVLGVALVDAAEMALAAAGAGRLLQK